MVAKHSRHLALTGPLTDYVAGEVMKGEYASASEMVRTALRLLMDHKGQKRHSSDPDDYSLALEGDLSIRTILELSHQNQGLLTPEGKIIYVNATALASINGARGEAGRLMLATLLKTRQDFGCFPTLDEIHPDTLAHLASQLGLTASVWPEEAYRTGSFYRYQAEGSGAPFRHAVWRRGRRPRYGRTANPPQSVSHFVPKTPCNHFSHVSRPYP
jgi:antitoxin ParD1/3/4